MEPRLYAGHFIPKDVEVRFLYGLDYSRLMILIKNNYYRRIFKQDEFWLGKIQYDIDEHPYYKTIGQYFVESERKSCAIIIAMMLKHNIFDPLENVLKSELFFLDAVMASTPEIIQLFINDGRFDPIANYNELSRYFPIRARREFSMLSNSLIFNFAISEGKYDNAKVIQSDKRIKIDLDEFEKHHKTHRYIGHYVNLTNLIENEHKRRIRVELINECKKFTSENLPKIVANDSQKIEQIIDALYIEGFREEANLLQKVLEQHESIPRRLYRQFQKGNVAFCDIPEEFKSGFLDVFIDYFDRSHKCVIKLKEILSNYTITSHQAAILLVDAIVIYDIDFIDLLLQYINDMSMNDIYEIVCELSESNVKIINYIVDRLHIEFRKEIVRNLIEKFDYEYDPQIIKAIEILGFRSTAVLARNASELKDLYIFALEDNNQETIELIKPLLETKR